MRRPIFAFAVVALLLLPPQARPQETSRLAGWSLDLTTYGWLSAITGTTGAGPLRVDVDNNFTDTLQQSDSLLSFMARGEIRRGRLGLFLDGQYTSLGYDDVRVGSASADASTILGMLEFGAAYEVAAGHFGRPGAYPWAVDVLGGGRWMHLENKVSVAGLGSASSTTDWVDPFAGARLRGRMGGGWEYMLRGDVGGGMGGTRLAWQVLSTLGYRFEMFGLESTALIGYRALSQDYESAKLVWDMTLHGPLIGLNIRF